MLNAQSAKLAAQLEAQAGAEATVSVKEMAKYGRKLSAAKSAKAKPSWLRRTGDLFSSFGGLVKKAATSTTTQALIRRAAQAAPALGLQIPFDKDIARLSDMKRELSSLSYQMQDILSKTVPRLLARKEASTDLKARNLQTAASQAKANLAAVLRTLDSAQAAAQQGKRDISAGKLPAQASAVFAVKKAQADSQYKQAKSRAEEVRRTWQDVESALVSSDTPKPSAYVRAAAASGAQFASQAGGALTSFGEGATEAVKEVAKGAKAATPFLKYWPVAAAVALGAYVYSTLPKSETKPQ